jgi:hypothetical protein
MANISAIAKTPHVITAQEAAQGYAVVHVTWPSPFYDTNYAITFGVEDTSNLTPGLNFSVGDKHNVTPQGFDATVYLLAVPIVQQTKNYIGVGAPETILYPVLATGTFVETLYYQSLGLGDSSTLWPTLSWTDPQGNVQTLTIPYLGTISGDGSGQGLLQNYSLPVLALGGTTISLTTQFGNSNQTSAGNPFQYNWAVNVQALPQTAGSIVGNKCVVHAMASHR